MIYNEYDIGDMIRLDIDITSSGTHLDPNYLALSVLDPLGVEHYYVYSQTGTFIRSELGKFYLDFYARYPGQHRYRFYCSGTAWGAEVKRFVVRRL